LKKYLITGLLVWIPIVITIWVVSAIITTIDAMVPRGLRPEDLFGRSIPGLGVIAAVLVLLLTGVLVSNILGQRLLRLGDAVLRRIPVVSSIYTSVKQVSDTLLSPSGQAFRKAVLVQWPHDGVWTIAFLTGVPGGDVVNHLPGDYVSVYVPTTPNPTGGYFVMLRRADVLELDMSVDAALKYVISMGVAVPGGPRRKTGALRAPPL
jgi:uncharacterized membrane protein